MPEYGLLMDLDGTIADTLPHLFRAFRHAVAPFLDALPTDVEIVATFGPPERDCIAQLLYPHVAVRGGPTRIPPLDNAVQRFHEYYEGYHEEVKPFPGIPEVIQLAHDRGYSLGVFTGKGRRSAIFTLEKLGLWEYVDYLVSGEEVRCPKPDPEGVRLALEHSKVTAERLVVVGDAPADIRAGKAAGAKTVAALWGAFDPSATIQAGPTWAFSEVKELRALIQAGW